MRQGLSVASPHRHLPALGLHVPLADLVVALWKKIDQEQEHDLIHMWSIYLHCHHDAGRAPRLDLELPDAGVALTRVLTPEEEHSNEQLISVICNKELKLGTHLAIGSWNLRSQQLRYPLDVPHTHQHWSSEMARAVWMPGSGFANN